MKTYVHARLHRDDRLLLEELKRATGLSESEIVRRGLHRLAEQEGRCQSALDLAGRSVGRFEHGPRDLSTNPRHLEGFGK